jgi:hypothetical protein
LSWRAATKLQFESEFVRGDEVWVALPQKASSLRQTGTFDLVSGSKFVLRETEGGSTREYTGNYLPRQHGKAMLLKLDKVGRAALAKKIERLVAAEPLDGRVTIQSVNVRLNKVTQPVLERPKVGEKQKVLFTGTGTYRVLWRFYWVWPLPAAYGYSTWHFTFRETLVVGPGA